MTSLTLKSSWVKIVAPILVVLLFLLLVCYHFGFIRYVECVAVFVFSIAVLVSLTQYTILQCTQERLLIHKPFALYSRNRSFPLSSLTKVELKNFRGPYLKITTQMGPPVTIAFGPLRTGEQDALRRYFHLFSVPVAGFN